MNATAKFYTSLFLVLVAIVAISYYAGFRAGARAGVATHRVHVVPATP